MGLLPHLRRSFALVVFGAAIVASAWSLASPAGSSPDDEFHLASIWCAWGVTTDICESTADPEVVRVPALFALRSEEKPCFAFHLETSGACLFDEDADALADHPAARVNGGLYPPVYYATMRFAVTPHSVASTFAVRVLNGAIAIALIAMLFAVARPHLRQALAGSLAVTLIPLGLFIVNSVNPSAWVVIGCATGWAALIAISEAAKRRTRWLAGILLACAAALAISARADGIVFLAVTLVAAVVAHAPLRALLRRHRPWLIVIAAAMVIAAGLLIAVIDQARVSLGRPGTFQAGDFSQGIADRIYRNIVEIPGLLTGSFGTWPVGQFDAPVPAMTWIFAFGTFAALIAIGLGWRRPGKSWALALIAAAFVLIPLFIYVRGGIFVGSAIQPRYLLPLLPALVGIALLPDTDGRQTLTRQQRWLFTAALSLAQAAALHAVLRRYVAGTDVTGWNLNSVVEWWWSWLPGPMLVWVVASLAFAYLAYRAFALFADDDAPAEVPSSAAPVPESVP